MRRCIGSEVVDRVIELRRKGYSYSEIARETGCSKSTVYKILRGLREDRIRICTDISRDVYEILKTIARAKGARMEDEVRHAIYELMKMFIDTIRVRDKIIEKLEEAGRHDLLRKLLSR